MSVVNTGAWRERAVVVVVARGLSERWLRRTWLPGTNFSPRRAPLVTRCDAGHMRGVPGALLVLPSTRRNHIPRYQRTRLLRAYS